MRFNSFMLAPLQVAMPYQAFFAGAAFLAVLDGLLLPKEPLKIFPFFVFLSPLPIQQMFVFGVK